MAKKISADDGVVDVCNGENPGKGSSKTDVDG